ncbi:TBC1 domain family member 12-like isoform X1 [Mastacembelus armatus]|uniref:TBC1 domain family member 12-like isoform X1 n=1 Tax=Mastacembelus armatus TaxID=205130 RepID=UPI000E4553AA|nr:TBC1 domain family member 12-like isoform X1 [Mastacembelus armatus]
MERNDGSSSPVIINDTAKSAGCDHHDPASSTDDIFQGCTSCPCSHPVMCSGNNEEGASGAVSQCVNHAPCIHPSGSGYSLQGPIGHCSEVSEAGDRGARFTQSVIHTTHTDRKNRTSFSSDNVVSCTNTSAVNPCEESRHRGGGATGSTVHLDKNTSTAPTSEACQVDRSPTTTSSDSSSHMTSDLPEVSSDDEAFITEPLPPRSDPGPPVPATHSRNTFECGRRQSAPSQLVQDRGGSESELQSRRPGIVEYFSSRKQRSVSQSVPGWKLFGKVPPRQSPSKQAQIIQQSTAVSLCSPDLQDPGEFEARQVTAHSSPTHHASEQQSRRKVEFEPLSTTALILEDRPPNLPAKSAEETQRHRQQYEQMVAGAKRRELKEAQRRQQQMKERFRQEEVISNATLVWNQHILPHWDTTKSSRRAQELWWGGLPPSVRGRIWSLAIGNELNITAELYEIFLSRAKEKWTSLSDTEDGASLAEPSVELITQDISRTFPSLCVFQKGGPYHNLLRNILGAYTCYRPDVGYVQGMSSIAAVLILNMGEAEAFISFSNLINRPCQLAFYRVDHQLMCRYFRTFQVFLEETLPRLFLHFQSLGLSPDLYLMDWILSLYTKPLPLDVACRVWDLYFRDGEEFLFRAALGILRLFQDVLLHMDLISVAQFLSRPPGEELLSDRLFSCILATPLLSGNRKWSQVLSSCSC